MGTTIAINVYLTDEEAGKYFNNKKSYDDSVKESLKEDLKNE